MFFIKKRDIDFMHHCMWFAMSATFRGEMKMKVSLEELGFACYVPMKQSKEEGEIKFFELLSLLSLI